MTKICEHDQKIQTTKLNMVNMTKKYKYIIRWFWVDVTTIAQIFWFDDI